MRTTYSIITPTHNSSDLITKLLDSIPTRDDIEIIIIDDHSDDYPVLQNIVQNHRLSGKVQLLQNKDIRSAGAARNLGLKQATGKWIVFADSDDCFTENISIIFDKYRAVSADLIFFKVEGNHLTHRVHNLNSLLMANNLDYVRYRHVVPWGKIVNRSMIEKYNIDFSKVLVSNDELFSAKVGVAAKDIIIEQLAGYYSYEREGSLTTQTHDTAIQDIRMNEILKKYKLLRHELGQKGIRKADLSVFANIRKAVSVGGLLYGLRWYIRLWRVGGRINPLAILKGRFVR
jgi:glycosyltransferase involved in cell wall biosynthesis